MNAIKHTGWQTRGGHCRGKQDQVPSWHTHFVQGRGDHSCPSSYVTSSTEQEPVDTHCSMIINKTVYKVCYKTHVYKNPSLLYRVQLILYFVHASTLSINSGRFIQRLGKLQVVSQQVQYEWLVSNHILHS